MQICSRTYSNPEIHSVPLLPAATLCGVSPGTRAVPGENVPAVLPQDMELCYRLLRRLVPGVPRGRAASRVEILQHVIDYIRDLQNELDASCPTGGTNLHTCQPEEFLKTTEVEEIR